MTIKEFEKLLNAAVKERGLDKNERISYEINICVSKLAEEILNKIPDIKFFVTEYRRYDEVAKIRGRLYIKPELNTYLPERFYICEMQIHKTLISTDYKERGLWVVNKVSVNPLQNYSFEEMFEKAKEYVEEEKRIYEEYCEKKRLEQLEQQKIIDENGRKNAEEVMKYIIENNLDTKEFVAFAHKYYTYWKYFDNMYINNN